MKHIRSTNDFQTVATLSKNLTWTVKTAHIPPGSNRSADSHEIGSSTLTAGIKLDPNAQRSDDELREDIWKVNPAEMHAILALWLHTLQRRETIMDTLFQKYSSERFEQQRPAGRFLRMLGYVTDLGSDHPMDYVGDKSIVDWIEAPIILLPSPFDITRRKSLPNAHEQPVFGMYMSGRLLQHSTTLPTDRMYVAIINEHSLHQECALELLSLFVSVLVSQISWIGGTTRIKRAYELAEPAPHEIPQPENIWTNTAINGLSTCIVRAGLVDTLAEANAIIIPALFNRDLLPRELGKRHPESAMETGTEHNVAPGHSGEDGEIEPQKLPDSEDQLSTKSNTGGDFSQDGRQNERPGIPDPQRPPLQRSRTAAAGTEAEGMEIRGLQPKRAKSV